MRDDSILFSASVTKMFVTVAVMQQVEQGKFIRKSGQWQVVASHQSTLPNP
jgi:Beta-lactamase